MARSILHLIARKRDGLELSSGEIGEFISGVCSGAVPEYQIGAMLMAIYLRGMTDRESADLTMAMVHSGEVLDLSAIPGFKVDKHSTGGVGDKVTPILAPLVAAAGVYVPKLSGRGLGHTGGTLDKLESIPGFRVDLSKEEFIRQVAEIGLAISGQTAALVPADGVLYSLRDVTATVDSIPLIASSVMSKKIAAGADGIVLDVKCGNGAFMRTREQAEQLARLMVSIGQAAGKRTVAFVTSMDEPLGYAVGNAIEIAEVVATLRTGGGSGPIRAAPDLREICLLLGAHILTMAGQASSVPEASDVLTERLDSGAALEKLRQMIEAQGGDPRVVDRPELLPRAREVIPVPSREAGFVRRIDALQVGTLVMDLGAGRRTKGEPVDHAVGIAFQVRAGDRVEVGESLAQIHTNGRIPHEEAVRRVHESFEIGLEPQRRPHVLEVLSEAAPRSF